MPITRAHLILYVRDQRASAAFYRAALSLEPGLDVPGRTEFELGAGAGIERLLPGSFVARQPGALKAELNPVVPDPESCHARALAAGARRGSLAPSSSTVSPAFVLG